MDPGRRRELTRFGAPAAFLAAATIAVLLVKAGLGGGSGSPGPTVGVLPTATHTTSRPATTTTKLVLTGTTAGTTAPATQYYVIRSGDTLGSIALRYKTTVNQLMTLNPSINPNALHPGDRIRVS